MRILLTGASGVVGRRAVPMLLAQGHQVTVAARPGSRRAMSAPVAGVRSVPLDIFDGDAARRLMQGHQAVINLATRVPTGVAGPFLPGAWVEMDRIRRVASRTLALAAKAAGVQRFVQESFAPIYADAGARWIDETSPVRTARYNRTVLDAEGAVDSFGDAGGVGVVLRFALFYGDHDGTTRTLIEAVRHRWFPLFGRPDGYLSMIHHEDAATAVVAALTVPSGIYNVVDDDPLTRRELGDALAGMLHVKPPRMAPAWLTKLGGSVAETIARSLRISNRKLRQAAGWAPRYPSAREGWRAVIEAAAVHAPDSRMATASSLFPS